MKFGICGDAKQISGLLPGTADFAELNLARVYSMTDGEIDEEKRILSECGVPAEAANCFFKDGIKLCGKAYDRFTVADYCKKALYNAARLGIHTCVLGGGRARNIDDGENEDDCVKQFEEAVLIAGEAATEFDTTIVIEPLNSRETNLINTTSRGAELCRKLNRPNIKLLADFYHVTEENEDLDKIEGCGDLLEHIHIACPGTRFIPAENDGYDYSVIKNALKKAGYDKRVSIEAICNGDFATLAQNGLTYLKRIFD